MFDVIQQFFDSLLGITLPAGVYQILSFTIVSELLGKFFSCFGLKSRLFTFASRVVVILLSLLNVPTIGLDLNVGG